MIIKLNLKAASLLILPKSYNHLLQAFFYRNMDPVLSRFLHDVGFVHGKRRFKLFTFSKIIGNLKNKSRKAGKVCYEPDITLYFASPLMDIVSSAVQTFLKRENLFLGRNKLNIESVEILRPEVEGEITVKCLSPITVYRTPVNGRRKEYLNPWQDEFYELVKKNLLKKYEIIYSKTYKGELGVEPVKLSRKYRKKVVYRGSLIEAWEGYFRLRGDPEMLKLALEAGLGAKNPQGFGMVERVL